ncbi:hypothetical protein VIBNISOn1_1050005 [Vibrio nigripulchritudo SOn1]|uniref:Uncharacterized protein n=1 Tax=Vibrio nigripulchritudo SOn1 TaxID=1238450 RepID=A0AAV2VIB5_9VIBR|nr:hypothetical protein [Vibrio nigripulchritudo]CCO44179.1 hypothetical protein VIBNISOn1_1050005 [Vibrio nigripulchritudo SOn1]
MQKNLPANRDRLEQEANLILCVALEIASAHVKSNTIKHWLSNPDFSYEFAWCGTKDSETLAMGETIHIRFALHDLFGFEKNGLYYYSESTDFARKAIPCGYVSARAGLCALISHEVAHAVLFCKDLKYGARPHNRAWLDLTLYLRKSLLPIFDYCPDRSYQRFMAGSDVLNFEWELLMSYVRHYDHLMIDTPRKQGFRFYFKMVGAIIERLIVAKESAGLTILSNKLFKAEP